MDGDTQGEDASEGDDEVVSVSINELEEEIGRLRNLEESARYGDVEREYVAGSAREFLESVRARA